MKHAPIAMSLAHSRVSRVVTLAAFLFLFYTTVICVDPVVTVLNGSYTGLYLPEFHQDVFLGMPYAKDTGGENRFRVPQTLTESWKGVREARYYGPACPDEDELKDGIYGMSENCLSINVIRPSGINETANLPVMFWIHGGRLATFDHTVRCLNHYTIKLTDLCC